MTQEEVIQLAKQALLPYYVDSGEPCNLMALEHFAQLVAAAEREACAKVCYDLMLRENPYERWEGMKWCMDRIRARGQQ